MAQELSTVVEAEVLDECQDAIGYRFQNPQLLRAALTHTSGANTRLASNERMEFLGDAVLGLVCCEQLYKRFPEYQEGDLTKVKSVVVSRRVCARISKKLNLGEFLFMGRGMHGAWGRNKKEAEQRAAMNALAQVNGEPIPFEHD